MRRRGKSWIQDIPQRHRLIASANSAYPDLKFRRVQGKRRVDYIASTPLHVPNYGERKVTINFGKWPHVAPVVRVDGPNESPHRFPDTGSLCIWYPYDSEDKKWVPEDGLLELLGMTQAHLFKEAYWRETGEWLGDEAPHKVPSALDPTGCSRAVL